MTEIRRKLIVLDLDETLVFSTRTALERAPDFWWAGYAVYRRPGVQSFLQQLAEHFRVAVWTAADASYAGPVLDRLLPGPLPLEFLFTGNECTLVEADRIVLKDLGRVFDRGFSPTDVLLIDNHASAFRNSPENGVLVRDFTGDEADDELARLLGWLVAHVHAAPDVRVVDKDWGATAKSRPPSVDDRA